MTNKTKYRLLTISTSRIVCDMSKTVLLHGFCFVNCRGLTCCYALVVVKIVVKFAAIILFTFVP
jgi:hypothetical protein